MEGMHEGRYYAAVFHAIYRVLAVDVHVVFDDVNYIRRGWMHRNRILINGSIHYLNLPIQKASQNKKINDTWIAADK